MARSDKPDNSRRVFLRNMSLGTLGMSLSPLLISMLGSCTKDFLDKQPDDMLTLQMVFKDPNRVREWLTNCYGGMDQPYDFSNGGNTDPWMAISDEVQMPSVYLGFGQMALAINAGSWNPASSYFNKWGDLYKRIRSIHIFLDNIHAVSDQLSQAEVDEMITEARFLRVYYYFLLWREYGPVPLILRQIPADAPDKDFKAMREPNDSLVNWMDKELTELSGLLPVSRNSNMTFTPTKGAALAVKARMLLYAASPLYNGNADLSEVKNPDKTPLFNPAYDKEKWKKAIEASRELLDLAESGVYTLYTEYKEGLIDPYLSYMNLFLKGGSEVIFEVSGDYATWDRRTWPRSAGSWAGFGVFQSLVDDYFMNNGLPIDAPGSGYVENGFSTRDLYDNRTGWTVRKGKSGLVTEKGTFNMYVNREPRFYVSVTYNNENWLTNNRRTDFKYGAPDGLPHQDTPPTGYLVRKRTSFETDILNNIFTYRPAILFRLGEVYLNYAEALNEYDPGHPDILKYLNRIRERAGIPQYGSGAGTLPVPDGQPAMREAIRKERRIELAFEALRYFDTRRWKIAEQTDNGPVRGMNLNAQTNDDFFRRTVEFKRVFTPKMYFFPIPQSEMNRNENLVQNADW